jgi:hypothetical protein
MKKVIFGLFLVATAPAIAAGDIDAQERPDTWTFRVTPYFIGAAMDGDLTVNGHTAPMK